MSLLTYTEVNSTDTFFKRNGCVTEGVIVTRGYGFWRYWRISEIDKRTHVAQIQIADSKTLITDIRTLVWTNRIRQKVDCVNQRGILIQEYDA